MATILIFEEGKGLQYLLSVNEPDYCVSVPPNKFVAQEYAKPGVLINPDLTSVEGIDRKYWKKVGTSVVEMSKSEKKAIDDKEQAEKDAAIDKLEGLSAQQLADTLIKEGVLTKEKIKSSMTTK